MTLDAKRPSQRARMRLLEKSSAFDLRPLHADLVVVLETDGAPSFSPRFPSSEHSA